MIWKARGAMCATMNCETTVKEAVTMRNTHWLWVIIFLVFVTPSGDIVRVKVTDTSAPPCIVSNAYPRSVTLTLGRGPR